MNIKTERLRQKDKSYKYKVTITYGKNRAVFWNDGSGKLDYEDFIEGMIECGSIFWMYHLDGELYCLRHWGVGTKNEQAQIMKAFINKCLDYEIKFSDYLLEYEA